MPVPPRPSAVKRRPRQALGRGAPSGDSTAPPSVQDPPDRAAPRQGGTVRRLDDAA
jgi:hypothetical protein